MCAPRIFAISFIGSWPIGAYATVQAFTEEQAKELFFTQLQKDAPELFEKNMKKLDAVDVTEIETSVYFHSYGEY